MWNNLSNTCETGISYKLCKITFEITSKATVHYNSIDFFARVIMPQREILARSRDLQNSVCFVDLCLCKANAKTRMHSSRMRTGRMLTVFRNLLFGGSVWSRGVPAWSGEVSGSGGCTCLVLGGCLVQGGVPAWSWGVSGPRGGVPAWSRGVSGRGVRHSPL